MQLNLLTPPQSQLGSPIRTLPTSPTATLVNSPTGPPDKSSSYGVSKEFELQKFLVDSWLVISGKKLELTPCISGSSDIPHANTVAVGGQSCAKSSL